MITIQTHGTLFSKQWGIINRVSSSNNNNNNEDKEEEVATTLGNLRSCRGFNSNMNSLDINIRCMGVVLQIRCINQKEGTSVSTMSR